MQFSGFFRKHRAILFLIILLLMSALPKYLSSEADTHLSDEGFEGSRFPNFDIRAKQFTDVTLTSNNLSEVDFGDVGLASRLNGRLKLEEAKVQLQTLKQKVSGLQLRWSELQETPRTIFSYQMPLTETSTATTESIARRFISNNNVLYGFDGTSNDLKIVRNYTTRHNGLRHLVLQQESNGLQVFGAEARFTIDAKGQVVMVASDLAPSISSTIINTVAKITALQALKLAAENVELVLDERVKVASKSDSVERATTFTSGNSFANSPTARLMLFPMSKGNVRLAWQVRLASRYSPDSFAVFIDAEKGTVLLRQNMTWYFADRPQFRVFTTPSPQPNIPFVSLNPALVARELAVETADPIASPKGWLDPANPTTVGNNVIAQEDLDANNVGGFRPVAQNLLFDYPLTLATVGQEPEMFQAASVTNLFYRCNLIHDYLYRLGFDEAAGNFQVDNFGRGGLGGDPVIADAQDGASFNNAVFGASEDGSPGRMQMYLWNRVTPKIDGAYDSEVIVHEYIHGLTTRLVGGPQNAIALFGTQSGGMGEGWSDWYALTMLSRPGDNPRGRYPFGSYVSRNFEIGIRRFAYSSDMNVNPLTYADLDPKQSRFDPSTSTQVHRVGTIWGNTLWDIRADFIEAFGFERGKNLIEQLVTDGLKLSPSNPSFVDARDAILMADQVDNNGENQCLLWKGFARRGLGFKASSINGSSSSVTQSFDLPPFCKRTATIELDQKAYSDGEMVKITLGDADLVGSSNAIVTVRSNTTGDSETLQLDANSSIPGQFTGSIQLAFGNTVANDARLQTTLGDTFAVSYLDSVTDQGSSLQATASARATRPSIQFDDTIEAGSGKFKTESWKITNLFSRSPVNSWTDSPRGDYKSNLDTRLQTKKVSLKNLLGSKLIFWQRYDIERDFDFGFVEVKAGQQPWVPVASFTGKQLEFRQTIIDLSQFDGQENIRIRFRLVTDANQNADGWYIDDIRVVAGATS